MWVAKFWYNKVLTLDWTPTSPSRYPCATIIDSPKRCSMIACTIISPFLRNHGCFLYNAVWDETLLIGRLYHHLAILARSCSLQYGTLMRPIAANDRLHDHHQVDFRTVSGKGIDSMNNSRRHLISGLIRHCAKEHQIMSIVAIRHHHQQILQSQCLQCISSSITMRYHHQLCPSSTPTHDQPQSNPIQLNSIQ